MGQPLAASLGRNRDPKVRRTQTALLSLNYFVVLIHITHCQHLHPPSKSQHSPKSPGFLSPDTRCTHSTPATTPLLETGPVRLGPSLGWGANLQSDPSGDPAIAEHLKGASGRRTESPLAQC